MPRAVLTFADDEGRLWTVAAVLGPAHGTDGTEVEIEERTAWGWRLKDLKVIADG